MIVAIVASLLANGAPAPVCRRVALGAAVARYARLSAAKDGRRVAAMYAPEGILFDGDAPVTGPAEVERYLAGAGAYMLGDYTLTDIATKPLNDGWESYGSYRDGRASGSFNLRWRCTKLGWRVTAMRTIPS